MKNNQTTILITGATGYIGYNFSKHLIKKGLKIHLLVRSSSNLRDLESSLNTTIHYYNGNLESIEQIFNDNKIDFIFHLATYYDKSDNLNTFIKLNEVCIRLTTQLLNVLKKQGYSIGFINVGTTWQTHGNIDNAYTLFKVFQEDLVKLIANKYGIKSLSILLNDTYGPDDLRPKLLNQIRASIKEKKEIIISNPNTFIDLIYIDDICDALYHSMSLLKVLENRFNRFKISSQTSINLRDLIYLYESVLSQPIDVSYSNEKIVSQVIFRETVDDLPGWQPKVDLVNGLMKFHEVERYDK